MSIATPSDEDRATAIGVTEKKFGEVVLKLSEQTISHIHRNNNSRLAGAVLRDARRHGFRVRGLPPTSLLPPQTNFKKVRLGIWHENGVYCVGFIGPILWGHSGRLCHALSLLSLSLWTSIVTGGVRRLAVANGPNIF